MAAGFGIIYFGASWVFLYIVNQNRLLAVELPGWLTVMGLLIGLLIGGLLTAVSGLVYRVFLKRMAYGETEEAIGIRQVRRVELPITPEDAFGLCIESLRLIKGCRVYEENRSAGRLVARTNVSGRSFGEIIECNIGQAEENRVVVEISSSPVFSWTWVDYGKNLENVNLVLGFLMEQIRSVEPLLPDVPR